MWFDFFLANNHFILSLFAALVFFAVFWLHFDAWSARKNSTEAVRFTGFLFLSLSFLLHATQVESNILVNPFGAGTWVGVFGWLLRFAGYALVIWGQVIDPLQEKPETPGLSKLNFKNHAFFGVGLSITKIIFPILAFTTAFLYWRRATTGLERHLKPVGVSFFLLGISELLSLASLLPQSKTIASFNLLRVSGPVWIIEHLLLLVASFILGRWVMGYLMKRLQSQLFMIFNLVILTVFLITTVSFTFLLLRSVERESLQQLENNVRALNLAIDSKKEASLSDAQVVAQNTQVIKALQSSNEAFLGSFAENYLLTKKQSFLVILNQSGQVVARGEDKDRVGDSLSDDTLVRRALLGQGVSSVVAKDGVLAPEISVYSAAPIKNNNTLVGVVLTGTTLDNAFVDGLKKSTGLEVSIFGGNQLSATTLVNEDSATRSVGIKEEKENVKKEVLENGGTFKGSVNILNRPYLTVYIPLKDADNVVVGMLFVGKAQSAILTAAGESIALTFLVTAFLILISIAPAYLVSRYLTRQLS